LMQLQSAVAASRLFGVIEHHCRLVAPRTEAGCDEREWWEFHISVITGMTMGRRRVCL
jgi:hypothetical protein